MTQYPETQGMPWGPGDRPGAHHKTTPPPKLREVRKSAQTWARSPDSWLRFLIREAVPALQYCSVTRQPGPCTLALQGYLGETKVPLLGAWGPGGWWRAGRDRSRSMGETKDGPRSVREEWGGALCRGLRPSTMSPSVPDLWTLQTADAGEARGKAERMVGCQVDRQMDR